MIPRQSWVTALVFAAIAGLAVALSAYSGASSSQGFAPVQPVDFPHPRHVQDLGMNCLYCHYGAAQSPDPGIPAVATCMGCHTIIGPQRPALAGRPARRSAALDSLYRYAPPGQQDKWQPIPWVRIHKLPEYVRFPHMRHVNAGVTCQTCHGPVHTMERVYQFESLNMGWCVRCHVNGYRLSDGLLAAGDTAGARAAIDVEPRRARYDCAVCHY